MWSLRGRVTAYDAAYVALATALEIPLVTTDRKLAKLPDLPCAIEAL
jgi:predicted nucleic acid-binding protein